MAKSYASAPSKKESDQTAANEQAVLDFYTDFAEAYGQKNDALLFSLIADNWSCEDGTSLADVEQSFNNMFSVLMIWNFR